MDAVAAAVLSTLQRDHMDGMALRVVQDALRVKRQTMLVDRICWNTDLIVQTDRFVLNLTLASLDDCLSHLLDVLEKQ